MDRLLLQKIMDKPKDGNLNAKNPQAAQILIEQFKKKLLKNVQKEIDKEYDLPVKTRIEKAELDPEKKDRVFLKQYRALGQIHEDQEKSNNLGCNLRVPKNRRNLNRLRKNNFFNRKEKQADTDRIDYNPKFLYRTG